MAVATVLNFQNVEIFRGGKGQDGQNASPITMPNFAVIGQTVAEIWRFFDFQDGGRRHLGFLYFRNSKGWKDQVIKRVQMRLRVKFRGDQSGRC